MVAEAESRPVLEHEVAGHEIYLWIIRNIDQLIAKVRNNPEDDTLLAESAVKLAAELLRASRATETWAEKRQGNQLARMMDDASGKAFTIAMADQVFRPPSSERSASQFRHLVDSYGVPRYLGFPERTAMTVGSIASGFLPGMVMPAITGAMRRESSSVILPAEEAKLKPMLRNRRAEGVHMNLNQLGEAILGEGEAENRIQAILDRIADPECTYFSVKISAIFSQIHLVAYEESLAEIKVRLRRLYRAAMANPVNGRPKFVNLDMEEYRDLRLTCDVFRQVLDEPEFHTLGGGDRASGIPAGLMAFPEGTQSLGDRRAEAEGGAGIKIRIVKGANLAMESVDAELHDWEAAPYGSKEEVDANFKRMLHEGCKQENAAAVRLGIASHNLFDVAYALLLREREEVVDRMEFEMLEGMANHQLRVVKDVAGGMVSYAPIVMRDDFHSAIAYLVRRLDENTHEENFLHDIFTIEEGNAVWEKQKQRFLAACARKDSIASEPARTQNRATETHAAATLRKLRSTMHRIPIGHYQPTPRGSGKRWIRYMKLPLNPSRWSLLAKRKRVRPSTPQRIPLSLEKLLTAMPWLVPNRLNVH